MYNKQPTIVHVIWGIWLSPIMLFPIPVLGYFAWYEILYETSWYSNLPDGYINRTPSGFMIGLFSWLIIAGALLDQWLI